MSLLLSDMTRRKNRRRYFLAGNKKSFIYTHHRQAKTGCIFRALKWWVISPARLRCLSKKQSRRRRGTFHVFIGYGRHSKKVFKKNPQWNIFRLNPNALWRIFAKACLKTEYFLWTTVCTKFLSPEIIPLISRTRCFLITLSPPWARVCLSVSRQNFCIRKEKCWWWLGTGDL